MSILFLHGAVRTPMVPGLPEMLAEIADPTAIALPASMAEAHPDIYTLFDRVIALPGSFNDNALVELEVFRAHERTPFSRIVSAGEAGVLRAARLRKELGIAGQSLESALAYRDKVLMKRIVARAGIRVPRHRAVDSPTDLIAFARDVGYPIVVKPRSGAGSIAVQLLQDEAQLRTFLTGVRAQATGLSLELLAEEYVRGQLYHINGYATADGRIGLCWPASYLERGNLDVMSGSCVFGEFLLEADDPRVPAMNEFTETCLRALPWPAHGFVFHLELFETDGDRELVFCEVACRQGGGDINDVYSFGFGVDLRKASLRLQAGLAVPEHALRPRVLTGAIYSPMRTGRLVLSSVDVPSFPWLLNYDLPVKSGQTTNGPKSCLDSSAHFVVKGASTRELKARMDEVNRWFEGVASWEDSSA